MKFSIKCDCGRELISVREESPSSHPKAEITYVDSWDELGVRFTMYSGTCPVCFKHWEIEVSEELPQPAEALLPGHRSH